VTRFPILPRILVVDDEPGIRDLAAQALELAGYDVITAGNGAEGLRAIDANRSIDLLVTDITMPGDIDGWELARRAKTLRPGLHVIYTTGRPEALPGRSDRGPLLPKPWRCRDLTRWVQDILPLPGSYAG
jgi:CheY-like chemotaxis protein